MSLFDPAKALVNHSSGSILRAKALLPSLYRLLRVPADSGITIRHGPLEYLGQPGEDRYRYQAGPFGVSGGGSVGKSEGLPAQQLAKPFL